MAAALCFLAGLAFGFPALKLEGHYLALATFTLAIAMPQLLKYKGIAGWTGGVGGVLLDKPDAPEWTGLSADQFLYYLCLTVAALLFWLVFNLLRGRSGRAIMAIRDHPMAAATMGIGTAHVSLRDGILKCDCEWLAAIWKCPLSRPDMERTTGFEPATLTLAKVVVPVRLVRPSPLTWSPVRRLVRPARPVRLFRIPVYHGWRD